MNRFSKLFFFPAFFLLLACGRTDDLQPSPAPGPEPGPEPAVVKKVSLIGDSITTWKDWVPSGYSCHYPASSGNEPPTDVSQSYWHILINQYMKNAKFEKNIAYSGTNLADIPKEYFDQWVEKHPTSKTDWYGNDFITRYLKQGGLGNPDIVIINGGTNDWNHNCGYLVLYPFRQEGDQSRQQLRRTSEMPRSGNGLQLMNEAFARADAVKTFEEAKALVSYSFVDGYLKLIMLIHTQYPKAKIVMIVPTYTGKGMQSVINWMAEHYDFCRSVDLFAVNGFQDVGIWEYDGGWDKTKTYVQPHFPTHDFDPATGHGAHYNITGMKNIAEKIYDELGPWLEEE